MVCASCGFQNPVGMYFCGQCGVRLAGNPGLQPTVPLEDPAIRDQLLINRFITPQLSHKILATRGKIEGERRQVTALFVDIKGYTSLSEKIGEEAIYRLMERMYEIMITAVYKEEGSVQKLTGDGIFALFGAPVALEDAPLRACRAGITIQQKMQSLGDELIKEQNIRPLARVGIHTGPVVIGTVGTDLRMEFTALGDTVNLASRMESIAEPGSVYISEATHALAGPYIESTFIGKKQVKGKVELQKVYRVDGLKPHAVRFDVSLSRGLTPLVGRSQELDTLQEYCAISCKGTTLLVQIIGEPGVGKSRLVHELHNHIQNNRIFYFRANCMSFGRTTSYLPFIEIVKSIFCINDNDDRMNVERKIMQGLEFLGIDAQSKPFLLNLFSFPVADDSFNSLDAKLIGDRTREIITAIILNQCQLSPLVLAIEDLHWIDPASEQLLQQIITKGYQAPLMILCTTRPAYTAPWYGGKNTREIKLLPLSKDSAAHMIESILGSNHIDAEISGMIAEKTGCNPLFTEEMTRYMLDNGSLEKIEHSTTYVLTKGKSTVPESILDLLQTRFDRLDDISKTLLQGAAVIGQRFSSELAKQVSGMDDSFCKYLNELVKQDLIFPERVGDTIEYRFKHALLQDVIYDKLLKPRKSQIHQSVAEAIELLYPSRLNEWTDTLAHHWCNTGNAGKAVHYLALAGEKSFRMYALNEAHDRFTRLADYVESEPGCIDEVFFADALMMWAWTFVYRSDFKGMNQLLDQYLPRIESLGDKRRLALILAILGNAHIWGGRGKRGAQMLERAKALGEEIDDAKCMALSNAGLIWLYSYWTPDSAISDTMAEQCYILALASAERTNDFFFFNLPIIAMNVHSFMRSRFTESRHYSSKLTELGKRFHDEQGIVEAQWGYGFCNLFEGRYGEALENAEQSLRLSPNPLDRHSALAVKGGSLALMGKVHEGLELMLKVKREMIASDFLLPRAGLEIPLGAVMTLSGQMRKGVKHIHDSMKYWKSLGNYTQPVWGHVFLSDIYLGMAFGPPPPIPVILKNLWFVLTNKPVAKRKAKYHLEEVVNKSREYNMPGFLAKALYGLGVLAQAKKRHAEARSYFNEALKVAEESQLHIADKIRVAMASLQA